MVQVVLLDNLWVEWWLKKLFHVQTSTQPSPNLMLFLIISFTATMRRLSNQHVLTKFILVLTATDYALDHLGLILYKVKQRAPIR